MTSKPTEPPESGPAVEVPPHGEKWRPKVTTYPRGREPLLWIYLATGWVLAAVRARHDYDNGLVVYQVELSIPDEDGRLSRFIRAYAWGKDNVRPA